MVFQYCVVFTPTKKQRDDGAKPEIIVDVTSVIADSADQAKVLAARRIPESYQDRLDQCSIEIRSFHQA